MTNWATTPQPVGPTRWRFLPPSQWPDEDLVNLGADLEPPTVIAGYRMGVFPMEVTGLPGVLGWWSPTPRGILPLDGLRVTKSMRQSAKRFEIRVDTSFTQVMRACANPKRESGWITEEFVAAYTRLHELGWAHSIEAFDRKSGELAGGLYGVRVGRLFAGESMFFKQRDASKVALMALVDLMRETGMALLDVQWCTEHLATLGAIEIPRSEYLSRVADAIGETV
ncbi:MAG TPA: leucyl/phenylalanyl-tRNA--protein transferase [Vicinamibacterales bacterium]|nr:leucyl/phenylalanyl-tRNA--protein transferase [Vicinamibacterales bacterium]